MNRFQIESYFDAIKYFEAKFEQSGAAASATVKQMYDLWPEATMLLTAQGFFMAVIERN